MNNRQIGTVYEKKAQEYLESIGMSVVERNYRTRNGEIDLIMNDHGTLVFVEVKYRNSSRYGYAVEAIDYKKQVKLRMIAREYLADKKGPRIPIRFDCVGYTGNEVHYIKSAF